MIKYSKKGQTYYAPKWTKKRKNLKPHKFVSKFSLIKPPPNILIPMVYLTPGVINDQFILGTEMNGNEIGALGKVTRTNDNNFLVDELFVTEQRVNATTCEMSPGGQHALFSQLLNERPAGMEVCNSIRMWTHCHGLMSTHGSWQDDDQMNLFIQNCDDYFIRAIFNLQGKLEITLCLIDQNLLITDAPWAILGEKESITPERRAFWKKEIEQKVKKLAPPVNYAIQPYHYDVPLGNGAPIQQSFLCAETGLKAANNNRDQTDFGQELIVD